ncbi:MAG: sensor histidine kinase [Chromatiales bacterium]|nr:sensor histidine kinase [Gammaproteobacteria bacterium]
MLKTLYAKLATGLVLLLAAIGLLYALISTTATRHYVQEVTQQFNRDLARNLVADRNLVEEGRLNNSALQKTFQQYMVINPSIEIYLLDPEGRILSYSADPGKVKRKRVSLEPIENFLHGRGGFPLLGDDPRSHDRRKAFSVTPVPSAERPEGYLYVVLRGEEFDSVDDLVRESYFLRLSGWAMAASLVIGLLAGLAVFRLLTRRLHRLSNLMDRFRRDNFSHYQPYTEAPGGAADEVDRLGETFDRMALQIQAQIDQLKEKDHLRRHLVAQVSHDLRTPLSSIQGYLESLTLKADSLDPAARDEYIAIALRQSRRLSAQVEELFELASLDARETLPKCEHFPLAELLQDVVQKYRLRAEQQEILLSMDPPESSPFVFADIALTERGLENLIENAFRHTPADGSITLALGIEETKVSAVVSDSGSGISEEDLPHLFEPFFQSRKNAGSSGHAGLGLAIARRIAELQGGEITVKSRLGKGSHFALWLPRTEIR